MPGHCQRSVTGNGGCPWWGQQNCLPDFTGMHPQCRQDMEHLVPAGTWVGAPAATPSASGELVTSTELQQHSHCCPGTAPAAPPTRSPQRKPSCRLCLSPVPPQEGAAGAARQCWLHPEPTGPALSPAGSTQHPAVSSGWCPRQCQGQHRAHSSRRGGRAPFPQGSRRGSQGRCSVCALRPKPAPGTGDTSPREMLVQD